MDAPVHVGLFGKMPQLGDFVARRLHPAFHTLWDEWLQESLAESERALGSQWLDVYLTSPVWRFVLSSGVCGEAVHAGVLVPSVDQVGRYFPLSIVASLPRDVPRVGLLLTGKQWFEAAQNILLAVLEGQIADVDELDRQVCALEGPLAEVAGRAASERPLNGASDMMLLLPEVSELQPSLTQVATWLLDQDGAPTYWLTEGSARVSPRMLIVQGLPKASDYAAMLDGTVNLDRWRCLPVPEIQAPVRSRIVAAVSTDRGHARSVNEDCAISRPDLGLWVVADGLGGYENGAEASALVCSELEVAPWHGDLTSRVEVARQALRTVNEKLRGGRETRDQEIRSASTVVLLLIVEDLCACVWSGDSRLYRLRGTDLVQITEDHAVGPRSGKTHENAELTACIGMSDEPSIEVLYDTAQPGDRYLLCSDGLHRQLDEAEIVTALVRPAPALAALTLIADVLTGSAPDNVTAVTVFVER